MNKILAVVGQAGSGKDTAANYISKKYGFLHISTADILREYIKKNSLGDLSRQNMSRVIEELRLKRGNDVLVKLATEGLKDKSVILSALRHPEESALVKKMGGIIIDTRADQESRYRRNVQRNREGDSIELSEFKKLENRENSGLGFDINKVESGSDFTINNNGSYQDFYSQIDKAMESILNS